MARDVKFWKDDGAFKLRVCGVIKQGNKFLISNCDNCEFYGFPGGHVVLGENTDDAVLREVKEETLIDVKISKLLAIVQLFFKRDDGKPFHEICYYYLLEPTTPVNTNNYNLEENDNGVKRYHNFYWLTLEEFENIDIRPAEIKNILKNNLERQHIIRYQDTF